MMPTFPRSPLSFRTASFPQYGWKADCPSGAFLGDRRLKPAPGIRRPPSSLHPPFVHFVVAVGSEEAPIEGLASVRRSNGTCSFPAFRFHEWLREIRSEGISETRPIYRVHQRVDLLLLTFERQMI